MVFQSGQSGNPSCRAVWPSFVREVPRAGGVRRSGGPSLAGPVSANALRATDVPEDIDSTDLVELIKVLKELLPTLRARQKQAGAAR
jgi:hypothetical protein